MVVHSSEAHLFIHAAGSIAPRGGLQPALKHDGRLSASASLKSYRLVRRPTSMSSSAHATHVGHMTANAATAESRREHPHQFASQDIVSKTAGLRKRCTDTVQAARVI